MAGVSVPAFRRQAKRFGAGLVWSEMVSAEGLRHGSRRTLDYLRIGGDEHPVAIQIFGADPGSMAEGARAAEAAGADLIDVNLGCPVKKVMSTGAGAALLDRPGRASEIVAAVAAAVSVPVTAKLRSGIAAGSRTCIELGPRLVEAGAVALVLHPRAQKEMYRGSADHALTIELASLVEVPVIASGDIASAERALELVSAGVAAVMVGRSARGNPWLLAEIAGGRRVDPSQAEVAAELIRFLREVSVELGERRAESFLKKFYGWYLRRGRFPSRLRRELVEAETTSAAEELLLAAVPEARPLLVRPPAPVS